VRTLVERVARIGELAGTSVCDVGCGYGGTALALARDHGARVTGLTVSARQWEVASRAAAGADNPRFLLADWLGNDLPDASFDRVLAIECLAHMHDKPAFFRQAHRVLRPGGRLAVCAWLACDRPSRWQRRHLLDAICVEGRLAGMPTEADCRALAAGAGLELERFEDWSARVRRTWTVCIVRLVRFFLRHPSELSLLADSGQPNRVFARTPFRIWLAYRTGCMRYGFFTARKP
jgi:tocopherol O-methyltransferase